MNHGCSLPSANISVLPVALDPVWSFCTLMISGVICCRCFNKSEVNTMSTIRVLQHFMFPFAWQALWTCRFPFLVRSTCLHGLNYYQSDLIWYYCLWLASRLAWPCTESVRYCQQLPNSPKLQTSWSLHSKQHQYLSKTTAVPQADCLHATVTL